LWSLLWHRPFSDFLNFRTATSFEFGNGKDALQPKTISAKWCGNIPDSPDWVSGNVWKRNIAMVLGPRPPRGNSFQEKDSHSPDRPKIFGLWSVRFPPVLVRTGRLTSGSGASPYRPKTAPRREVVRTVDLGTSINTTRRALQCGQHPESLFGNWLYIR